MRLFTSNSVSNVDALKGRNSEKEFYRYMGDTLKGYGLTKVASFSGLYTDLIYIEDGRIALFKFMDTNEETFSVLDEEIVEIMEEEREKMFLEMRGHGIEREIPYYFVMPYVDLEKFDLEDKRSFLIDTYLFERLINGEDEMQSYLSESLSAEETDRFRLTMAKEYHIVKKVSDSRGGRGSLRKIKFSYRSLEYQALIMDSSEIRHINSIKYGKTLLEGASGTGKTTILLSTALKLAKLFPRDQFLYITFDKQLVYELKNLLEMKEISLSNLKFINFHQYISQLAKPYGLKIDNQKGFREFEHEFSKVFVKVSQIYRNKKTYRGIFLDESENFSEEEIGFLMGSIYTKKSFFVASQDKAKDVKNNEKYIWNDVDRISFDEIIRLRVNYRSSSSINRVINAYTDRVREYAEEELSTVLDDYVHKGYTKRKTEGRVEARFCEDFQQISKQIALKIKDLHESGYQYSDICVVYPYNTRKTKTKGQIYYQYIIKTDLEEEGLPFMMASDEMTNMSHKIGVTLSNVYNIVNLEYKVLLICGIESLSPEFAVKEDNRRMNFLQGFNIVYSILNRGVDEVYMFFKEEDEENIWQRLLVEALQEE